MFVYTVFVSAWKDEHNNTSEQGGVLRCLLVLMCLSIVRKSFTVFMKAVYQFIINIKEELLIAWKTILIQMEL